MLKRISFLILWSVCGVGVVGRRRGRRRAGERPLEGVTRAAFGARLLAHNVQPAALEVLVQRAGADVRRNADQRRRPLPVPVCGPVLLHARRLARPLPQQLHRQGSAAGARLPARKASSRPTPPQCAMRNAYASPVASSNFSDRLTSFESRMTDIRRAFV